MKKTLQISFIIVFLALCALPLMGWIFGYENVNAEKRALAEMPGLVDKDGLNTAFTKEFDDYYTENFAFRPDLITMHAALESTVFNRSVSDQVIIGKDGWLFFTPTLSDFTKTDVLTDNEIYRIVRTLEIQQTALEQRGIGFVFTVAPNKASIYGEYMPDRYIAVGEKNNNELLYEALAETDISYVNLNEKLRGGKGQLYHKLDTHWNNTGAMVAYNALMEAVKSLYSDFEYTRLPQEPWRVEKTWEGDLSGMLYPSAGMLDEQHVYDVQQNYSSARPIRSMEDMKILVTCETGSLDALMFRDSFANALIPLMSNEFASITYSRATPYDYSLLHDDTDVVILEIVERNLPNILLDAPVICAPLVQLNADAAYGYLVEGALNVRYKDEYILVSGMALPPDYRPDADYDVYLSVGSVDGVFAAFPVCTDAEFSEYTNTSFSARIDNSLLPPGEPVVHVILYDRERDEYYMD